MGMRELLDLAAFLSESGHVIDNALTNHVGHMTEAAKGARAAFEAGHSDALVTNEGYRMSAEMFEQSAEKAREVRERLTELLEAVEESE